MPLYRPITGSSVVDGTIAKADLDASVQASLDLADSALQVAPVTSVDGDTGAVDLSGTYEPLGGSSQRFRLRRAAYVAGLQQAGTATALRWLTFGSSVADVKVRELGPQLIRAYGGQQVGAVIGSWGASSGPAGASVSNITTNSTTGTAPTARTADFDVWPSGLTTLFTAAGSRTYGIGGGSPVCDNIEIYYLTGPASSTDGGTFSWAVDGGAATNVDTSAVGQGIARVQISQSRGAHTVTIAHVSGNIRIVGVAFWDSTISGVLPMSCTQGGINLHSSADLAFSNFQTWLGWVNPDVITFEMKDSQVDAAAVPGYTGSPALTHFRKWLDAINAAATDNAGPDVVVIGSTPASNNGPQLLMNKAQAACCLEYQPTLNAFGWDGYTPLGDYANVLAMGWQNDGTHLDWKAQNFLAGLLARDIGLFAHAAQPSGKDVVSATVQARTSVKVGSASTPALQVVDAALDTKFIIGRNLIFRDSGDANIVAQFVGSGGSDTILPRYLRIGGTSYPFLVGASSSALGIGNNGSLSQPRDLILRSVAPVATVANISGAVSVDLSVACLNMLTLTDNVTSFAFASATQDNEEIEVHLIQDATGSRTLAGAHSSIKWAGGTAPTLTTTAGSRDVFRFRYRSGAYYEIGRSMDVR